MSKWQRRSAAPRSAPLRAVSHRNAKRRPFRGPFHCFAGGRSTSEEVRASYAPFVAIFDADRDAARTVNPATDRGTRWRGSEPRLRRQGGASRAGVPPNNVHRGPAFPLQARFVSVSSFQLCFAGRFSLPRTGAARPRRARRRRRPPAASAHRCRPSSPWWHGRAAPVLASTSSRTRLPPAGEASTRPRSA